jgi:hypothetical protein
MELVDLVLIVGSRVSLNIKLYSSSRLVRFLYLFISGFVLVGVYGAVSLDSRLYFGLLVGSCCKFGNCGLPYRKVALVTSLIHNDGSYCHSSRKLFPSYKFYLHLCLIISLCLLILGIDSIGSHSEENLGPGIYFVSQFQRECRASGGSILVQLGRGIFFGSVIAHLVQFAEMPSIDNRDYLEFRRILRRHEESIQSNRSSFFLVTTKVHENEHHCIS